MFSIHILLPRQTPDLSSSVYHTESHCKRAYVRRPAVGRACPAGTAAGDVIAEQLRAIDLNTITPLEAMRLLFELQQKARG